MRTNAAAAARVGSPETRRLSGSFIAQQYLVILFMFIMYSDGSCKKNNIFLNDI